MKKVAKNEKSTKAKTHTQKKNNTCGTIAMACRRLSTFTVLMSCPPIKILPCCGSNNRKRSLIRVDLLQTVTK